MRQFPNDGNKNAGYRMHHTEEGLREAVRRIIKALYPIKDTFDYIYVTGQSGMVPGGAAAYFLRKRLIILRKEMRNGHDSPHGALVEWDHDAERTPRMVIVDDFAYTGDTLKRLIKHAPGHIVCVCLYGQPRSNTEIQQKFSTEFWCTTHVGERRWRVIRKGEESLLFDLMVQEPAPKSRSLREKQSAYASTYGATADCATVNAVVTCAQPSQP